MSLTLTIEEENPELTLYLINTELTSYQFVYHINQLLDINFIKSREQICSQRNRNKIHFNYFTYFDEALGEYLWVLENSSKTIDTNLTLFSDSGGIEQTHHLLRSCKGYDLCLLASKHFFAKNTLHQLKSVPQQITSTFKKLDGFNKKEQQVILDIYYEKQD